MRHVVAVFVIVLVALDLAAPARAQDVIASLRARAWTRADAEAAAYADPVPRKLVLFYRVLTPLAASLGEIEAFAATSPDWPAQAVLARRRDEALAADPDDAAVLPACLRAAPALAAALGRCAQAALRQARPDDATRFARAAWAAQPADPTAEAALLQAWGPELGPDEHWRRFEHLAWTQPATAARAVPMLAAADRPAALAWLALHGDDARAGGLTDAVGPPRATTPLLVLEHLRWLRRAGRDVDALALWQAAGTTAEREVGAEHRTAFWDERNVLARRRLRAGDDPGAYTLAAGSAQTAPEQVAEAAFLAGWIALRRQNDPGRARVHFAALAQLSPAALTQSRAQYWLGRTAKAVGDEPAAARAFGAAAAFPLTFYGQLAAGEPGLAARAIGAARDPAWDRAQALAFAGRELARAAAWLVAWGELRRASLFLLRLAEVAHDPADLSLAAHLATGFAMPETAISLARRAGRFGVQLPQAGWPIAASIPTDAGVEPALALAVIRQESSFDTTTISPVGAAGLMQLMPETAAQVGRQINLAVPAGALLADPTLNIRLGSFYLRGVLDRFDAAVPLAVAAYNAGPNRVAEWLATNGDPRTGDPDMIDWIELIPFSETRNYVQRVIENLVVYRVRLGSPAQTPLGRWPHAPA